MRKNSICLIGCGWLGLPLAKYLKEAGHEVSVTTSTDRQTELLDLGIRSEILDLSLSPRLLQSHLNADVIIYTIPPLDIQYVRDYLEQLPKDKKIIFTSSTSVYSKNSGLINEEKDLDEKTSQSPVLVKTESFLSSKFKNITILRLGGLYGLKRHPLYFLQGRKNISGPNEYLHLVHLDDCIQAISQVLNLNQWAEIFNIVSDLRIRKKEYYHFMAEKMKLTPPEYTNESTLSDQQTNISNEKSKNYLKINYLDPRNYI